MLALLAKFGGSRKSENQKGHFNSIVGICISAPTKRKRTWLDCFISSTNDVSVAHGKGKSVLVPHTFHALKMPMDYTQTHVILKRTLFMRSHTQACAQTTFSRNTNWCVNNSSLLQKRRAIPYRRSSITCNDITPGLSRESFSLCLRLRVHHPCSACDSSSYPRPLGVFL